MVSESLEHGYTFDREKLVFDKGILQEGFLSTKLAAIFLDKSPNALRIDVCRGRIKAVKDGNRLKFRIRDLRNAFRERKRFK